MSAILYPGSFDPVTHGHIDVIFRLRKIFDEVVVLVTDSISKKYLFSIDERVHLLESAVSKKKGIKITTSRDLTVQFARQNDIRLIARSVRSTGDWEYEYALAEANKKLAPEVETIFLVADPVHSTISSSIVREISAYGGDTSKFVPEEVVQALKMKGNRK